MKTSHTPLGLVGWLLAFAATSSLAGPTPTSAIVVRASGFVQSTAGQSDNQPIRAGDILTPGSLIRTGSGKDCFVDLLLDGDPDSPVLDPAVFSARDSSASAEPLVEQTVVRLWADSALALNDLLSFDTGADRVIETRVALKHGRLSGVVKKMSAASIFEVRLRDGVVRVPSGAFDISNDGDTISVTRGTLNLAWLDPVTGEKTSRRLRTGQQYDFRNNLVAMLTPVERAGLEATTQSFLLFQKGGHGSKPDDDNTCHPVSPVEPPHHGHGPPFQPPGPPPNKPPFQPPGPPPGNGPHNPPGHGHGP
jgi:hypothetical protein